MQNTGGFDVLWRPVYASEWRPHMQYLSVWPLLTCKLNIVGHQMHANSVGIMNNLFLFTDKELNVLWCQMYDTKRKSWLFARCRFSCLAEDFIHIIIRDITEGKCRHYLLADSPFNFSCLPRNILSWMEIHQKYVKKMYFTCLGSLVVECKASYLKVTGSNPIIFPWVSSQNFVLQ